MELLRGFAGDSDLNERFRNGYCSCGGSTYKGGAFSVARLA